MYQFPPAQPRLICTATHQGLFVVTEGSQGRHICIEPLPALKRHIKVCVCTCLCVCMHVCTLGPMWLLFFRCYIAVVAHCYQLGIGLREPCSHKNVAQQEETEHQLRAVLNLIALKPIAKQLWQHWRICSNYQEWQNKQIPFQMLIS